MSSEKTIVIPDLVFLGEDTDKGGRLYAYACAMSKGKAKSEEDGAESTAFIPELEKTKLKNERFTFSSFIHFCLLIY